MALLWPTFVEGKSRAIIGGGGDERDSTKSSPSSPAGFWPEPEHKAKARSKKSKVKTMNVRGEKQEIRTPERSSPYSSPGTREDGDDYGIGTPTSNASRFTPPRDNGIGTPTNNASRFTPLRDNIIQSMSSWCSPSKADDASAVFACAPRPSPPKVRRKRTTAAEAYNKGMLLQYIIENCADLDCCTWSTSEDYYESKWQGHQPLSSPTWHDLPSEPSQSFGDAANSTPVSASEQRMMRRRLRRGVFSHPRRNAKVGGIVADTQKDPSFPKVHNKTHPLERNVPGTLSIGFPGDVVDPHLVVKKKWQPHCDRSAAADVVLPLPPKKTPKPCGCVPESGCSPQPCCLTEI